MGSRRAGQLSHSKVSPPLANGYGDRSVNALRQRLVLVDLKSVVALKSIKCLNQNGFLILFQYIAIDLDGIRINAAGTGSKGLR